MTANRDKLVHLIGAFGGFAAGARTTGACTDPRVNRRPMTGV